MALTQQEILRSALVLLDEHGLAALTMRRLAASLGIQAGALYWHVANKHALLVALADEILDGIEAGLPMGDWDTRINELAHRLRAALLAHRDGAQLVATAYPPRTGRSTTMALMAGVLTDAGFTPAESQLAALTLLHYVLGNTADEQSAVPEVLGADPDGAGALAATSAPAPHELAGATARFGFGLSVFVDGLRARHV
ncbi:TetR/AcrR family transcriptional regulator C-terminal domain-containing protein [Sanguibacter antarcticus]|uniref:TetR family transcriptional regulator n=1 Tax=Sanguibacter antarcticus TaxID=372484 RepID=A0A2A9E3F0_9MICO|nr:TetR/AcrR family transcriptional regulator C-terminal domain-containing protein [Sanguibacter antarcticus]PFG33343.1 TetR family transcriptional regulator [Sanguibacter antarcticus]